MAPHSSTLAWKIAWAEEPGRLQSMGYLPTYNLHLETRPSLTHSTIHLSIHPSPI